MTEKNRQLRVDISFLACIMLYFITIIFMASPINPFFFDLICLMITLLLLIVTYFTDVVTTLIFNIIFIFAQLVYVYYVSFYKEGFSLGYLFWLVMPTIFCLTVYGLTYIVKQQGEENEQLRKSNSRLSALDHDTNLRTLAVYERDFEVLKKVADTHDVPLSLVVIRIRHWKSLRLMMDSGQTAELIEIISKLIKEQLGKEGYVYIIDRITPTWGILTFEASKELKTTRLLLKDEFQQCLNESKGQLAGLNISLVLGLANYAPDEMVVSADLLAEGIRELQYDVDN